MQDATCNALSSLSKLGKLAIGLLSQPLDLFHDDILGGLSVSGLFNLLLEVLDVFRLEKLDQRIEFGELFLNDRRGWGGSFSLEVVGSGDNSSDGLRVSHSSDKR